MRNKRQELFAEIQNLFTNIPVEDLSAKVAGTLSELGCCLVELETEMSPVERFLEAYAIWKKYDEKPRDVWSPHTSNNMEAKVNKLFEAVEI